MSETTLSAQAVQEQVAQALATIKQADAECWAAKRAADDRCHSLKRNPDRQLERLKEQYQEAAHELAIAARECPYTHYGSHMDPDEVDVTAKGLVLTWDINGNYAPAVFVATWDVLVNSTRVGEEAMV
jgi:hypothetical protein